MDNNDERYHPNGDDRGSADRATQRWLENLMIHDRCLLIPPSFGDFRVTIPMDVNIGKTWDEVKNDRD